MGGQASPSHGPHNGTRPNKGDVTGSARNVINNKSQLSEPNLTGRVDGAEARV